MTLEEALVELAARTAVASADAPTAPTLVGINNSWAFFTAIAHAAETHGRFRILYAFDELRFADVSPRGLPLGRVDGLLRKIIGDVTQLVWSVEDRERKTFAQHKALFDAVNAPSDDDQDDFCLDVYAYRFEAVVEIEEECPAIV